MIKIEKLSEHRVALSIAASWAWGTGFLVGIQQMQTKGLVPFIIWGVANILTLTLFGYLCSKNIFNINIWDNKVIKVISFLFQIFCFILNANAIYSVTSKVIQNELLNYIITSIITFSVVLLMLKLGLRGCILSDKYKLLIAYLFGFIVVSIGLFSSDKIDVNLGINHIPFSIWSAIILLTSPFSDRQHWQRAYNSSPKAFYLGSLYFSGYIIIAFLASFFKFTDLMNVFTLLMILILSIATIDSSFVTYLDFNFSKSIKIVIAIVLSFSWIIGVKIGLLTLWSNLSIFRVVTSTIILIYSLYLYNKNK